MPRQNAPQRERKTLRQGMGAASKAKRKRSRNAPEILPPAPTSPEDVTVASIIGEIEQARAIALNKEQAAVMMTATMAKARLTGLFGDKSGRRPPPAAKFDGNYAEAARRVALLLRLGANQMAAPQKIIERKPEDGGDDGSS